jgi:hypothetical protein
MRMKEKKGEHPYGHAGQLILLGLFLVIWAGDSFVLHKATFVSDYVPLSIRLVVLGLALMIVELGQEMQQILTRICQYKFGSLTGIQFPNQAFVTAAFFDSIVAILSRRSSTLRSIITLRAPSATWAACTCLTNSNNTSKFGTSTVVAIPPTSNE